MSDTPRTDVAQHNMGSIMEPHYVVDADFSRYLERELVEAREQLRLCNVDQFTTAAELAEAVAKERERCAKVCETGVDTEHPTVKGHIMKNFGVSSHLAAAIRKGE
jgi:hypothetical protein